MNRFLVSVIIPAFNAAKFLPQTVESALNQTYKNVEVIVIDDGSTDETSTLSVFKDPRVHYVKIKHSGGPSTPRNVGIRQAQGNLVAFLDSDDVWLPEKLKKQLEFMRGGKYDLVSCDAGVIDGKGIGMRESYLGKGVPKAATFAELYQANFVITSSVILRKSILDRAELFDQNRKLVGVEDYDLWLRIAAKGAKFGFLSDQLLLYRERSGSLSDQVENLNYEREFKVVAKNFRTARKKIGSTPQKLRPFNLAAIITRKNRGKNLATYWRYKFFCFWYFPFGTGSISELWGLLKHIIKL